MKKPKQNVLIVFFTVFLCFVIIELVLRSISYGYKRSPGPGSSYIIKTPEYVTSVTTNSLNMRGHEIYPKRKDEFRILCLGDSFTFGLGVDIEDTYVSVMNEILNKDNDRFYVINGGIGSFAGGCYKFLIKEGIALEPDLVTVQIFIGNDFYDAERHLDSVISSSKRKDKNLFLKLKGFLYRRSYTTNFLWHRLVQIDYINELLFRLNLRYANREIFLLRYSSLEKQLVKAELEYLENINGLCNKNGIRVLFIIIPSKTQVFKKQLLGTKKYYYRKPNDIITTFCQDRDIPYIDFLDNYERLSYKDKRTFYYKIDSHWAREGHIHAAYVIADFIKNNYRQFFKIEDTEQTQESNNSKI